MSGLYIPKMELPPEGEYNATLYVCRDSSAYLDAWAFPSDIDRFNAIPIPTHGRMIDADALKERLKEWYDLKAQIEVWQLLDILNDERVNPTIIPAEEDET